MIADRAVRAPLVLVVILLLAGCAPLLDPGYYLLPTLPELYIYDDFNWSTLDAEVTEEEERWVRGATDGFPPGNSEVHGGNFISIGHRSFLLSTGELDGEVRITVEYQIFQGIVTPTPNNNDLFDYRIWMAGTDSTETNLTGPSVEISLWYDADLDTNPDSDELRVRAADGSVSELATKPHNLPSMHLQGTLEIDVEPEAGTIAVRFYADGETPLLAATGIVGDIPQPFRLALQASGDDVSPLRARTVKRVSVVDLEVE